MSPSPDPVMPLARLPRRQWLSLLLPPLMWSAQELLGVYVAYAACRRGDPQGARTLLLAASAIALPVASVAATMGYWHWRSLAGTGRLLDAEGRSREEFVALAGFAVGALFTLGIVWGALPLILLQQLCEARQ